MIGNGFVECTVRNDVKDRRERLLVHYLQIMMCRDEARTHVAASRIIWATQAFPAVEDFSSTSAHSREGGLHVVHGFSVDKRSHERLSFKWIADTHLLVSLHQQTRDFFLDGIVDDNTAGGCAALSGGADRSE